MRYDANRKEETRRKVVQTAATLVREQGPERLGVSEVMARAGLTHGGFYAHFRSKEDLLGAAVEEAFAQGRARFQWIAEGKSPSDGLSAFVDYYVSMSHRGRPDRGCAIAALTNDIPRQGPPARRAFDAGVQRLIEAMAERMPAGPPEARFDIASSCLAEMAGAVALSRAISDDGVAERLLDQSRRRVRARLGFPETSYQDTTS